MCYQPNAQMCKEIQGLCSKPHKSRKNIYELYKQKKLNVDCVM